LIDEESEKSEGDPQKKQSPELLTIKDAVALLNPGDVTDFMPSGTDGLIAILEKREPLGDASAGEKRQPSKREFLRTRSVLLLWNGCATGSKRQAWNSRKGNAHTKRAKDTSSRRFEI
jgi:hypothetical protein